MAQSSVDRNEFNNMYEHIESLVRELEMTKQKLADIANTFPSDDQLSSNHLVAQLAGEREPTENDWEIASYIEHANNEIMDTFRDVDKLLRKADDVMTDAQHFTMHDLAIASDLAN